MKSKGKKFSDLLKEKRQEIGYTQEEMAKGLGMSIRMYHYYENGDYDDTESIRREKYLRKLDELKPRTGFAQGNIIHIPAKAQGGFLIGYEDPIYRESLKPYTMPGIEGPHFSIDAEGFSMHLPGHPLSIEPGDRIFGVPVNDFLYLRKGKRYFMATIDGFVTKIFDRIEGNTAHFHSLNPDYDGLTQPLKSLKYLYYVDYVLKKS